MSGLRASAPPAECPIGSAMQDSPYLLIVFYPCDAACMGTAGRFGISFANP
jgi:hypothetical protein